MTPIQVVGIGLEGANSLTPAVLTIVQQATLLVGSDRHLSYFPNHPATQRSLGDLSQTLDYIRQQLHRSEPPQIVILTSGDPLFFGLGRLLLLEFPPEVLSFHPHLSAVQVGFSRVKVPWQDAWIISAHGRSLDELTLALKQGKDKIAVYTDGQNTPGVIARLLLSLDLPVVYHCWVCENLGASSERVQQFSVTELLAAKFEPLNLVILLREQEKPELNLKNLPLLGLPDHSFCSFPDRPGLLTKREVRVLALAELDLQPGQVIWDIGAGTGSVAIEIARLLPNSPIYAIEKTAIGQKLIQQNCQRFQVNNVQIIAGTAPEVLADLPEPDRVFIGGSGHRGQASQLPKILEFTGQHLRPQGVIVLALATLEHLGLTLEWCQSRNWQSQILQVHLARSINFSGPDTNSNLTRLAPLNPVNLIKVTADRSARTPDLKPD